MSKGALADTCYEIIAELEKTANSQGAQSARRGLMRQKGQILIINRTRFSKTLSDLLPQLSGKKNQKHRDAIWKEYDIALKKLEAYVRGEPGTNRLEELKDFVKQNKSRLALRANDHVYYVQSYRSAARAKSTRLKVILERYFQKNNIGYNQDDLRRVAGADNKSGAQIGHAETVNGQQVGFAASSARAAKAKQQVAKFSGKGKADLDEIIGKYETTMKMTLDHEQLYDEKGKFRKEYIPILSWQGSLSNQEQANAEQAAIAALIQDFKDLANKPGSTTMKNGIAQIMLNNVAGKKSKAKKVTGKKSRKVKDKGKGSAKNKVSLPRGMAIARDDGMDAAVASGVSKKQARGGTTSLNVRTLIGIMNERMAETIIKNMGDPRLNNRTGTFARSVEVVDVTQTPQGFPSIGYTYQRNPYETFEVGNAQGSVQRDPRRLIDVSIREIATSMAIGRLYTRRV